MIENAIKFVQPGGEVEVTAWGDQDEVGVTVKDNGPGIPADAREHIFDRFYRADPARGRESVAAGSALRSAGRLRVPTVAGSGSRARKGKGSAFSLALPRAWQTARFCPNAGK